MCGIAGISLSPSSTIPVRQLAHELLLHSEERGKVASGIGWAYGDEHMYVKEPKPGGHLPLRVLPKDARTVIVHTRNATYGDPEENDNNHPVVDDREEVILVHNGVISNHGNIRLGEKDVVFPEVDSSVIPWLLREKGLKGLSELDGWAALAWLNKSDPGVMNLARTKGNAPMVILYLKDGSLVFGSTFPIIHASLIRVGYGDQILGGWEVPEHTTIRVRQGRILSIGNLTPYKWSDSSYKTGPTMTQAEKTRLEKITNGDAVGYGKDAPVHAPTTGSPQPGTASTTKAPGYTSPYSTQGKGNHIVKQPDGTYASRSGTSSYTPADPKPPTQTKYEATGDGPKKDPLANFKPPKPGSNPVSSTSWSGSSKSKYIQPEPNSKIKTAGAVGDKIADRPMEEKLPKRPIPMYLESRLTYWVRYIDDEVEYMPFMPGDWYEDDGYLFNVFMWVVEDGVRNGLIIEWGVVDHENIRRFAQGIESWKDEAEAYKEIAHKLPPAGTKRRIPESIELAYKQQAWRNDIAAEAAQAEADEGDVSMYVVGTGGVHSLTDEEWQSYGGYYQ